MLLALLLLLAAGWKPGAASLGSLQKPKQQAKMPGHVSQQQQQQQQAACRRRKTLSHAWKA